MKHARILLMLAVLITVLGYGCTDDGARSRMGPAGPEPSHALQLAGQDLGAALAAQKRHTGWLMAIPGVVGTAVGLGPDGRPAVKIFAARAGIAGLPSVLDQVPVAIEVTGMFYARSDPKTRARPAPVGFSVGHPDITAGTIGARVKKTDGSVYILSNNHVLANSNAASLGDNSLQPGPADGGKDPDDKIGDLSAFQAIVFSTSASNTMDAAISLSSTANLGNSTPIDDGYGTPNSVIFGDGDSNGLFDNKNNLLNLNVQKYGRTTKLTKSQITEINVTVTVCYAGVFVCTKSARFIDQIAIGGGSFSDGGDSGSLIVTDNTGRNPVGLLFAGSTTRTIANRIDLVLQHFNVSIDGTGGGDPPPPPEFMHVGDLDGTSTGSSRWSATITIRVHDGSHGAVQGATVTGAFSNGATGTASCTTGAAGSCTVTKSGIRKNRNSVTFTVNGVTHATLVYDAGDNHDPDGGNGTSIVVSKP